jgi:diadenosine tetraphosphate (Ap4A) HIT family hydrolase
VNSVLDAPIRDIKCPFCLGNQMLENDAVISRTDQTYLIQPRADGGRGELIANVLLAIPFNHVLTLAELPVSHNADIEQLIKGREGFESFNTSLNFGECAGQTIAHLHTWILGRDFDSPGMPYSRLGFYAIKEKLARSVVMTLPIVAHG